MINLADSVTYVADTLSAAGAPAVVDARDVELPGVICTPVSFDFTTLDGEIYESLVQVTILCGDMPSVEALDSLSPLLDIVRATFPLASPVTAANVQLAVTDGGNPLPALITTVILRTTPEG